MYIFHTTGQTSYYQRTLSFSGACGLPADDIKVEFDLPALIRHIFIGPSLGEAEVEPVRQAAKTVGIAGRVRVSICSARRGT